MRFDLRTRVRGLDSQIAGEIEFNGEKSLSLRYNDYTPLHRLSRIFLVRGSQLTAYDNYSDETIHRAAEPGESMVSKLKSLLGTVPDPISVVIDPKWEPSFFKSLSPMTNYHLMRSNRNDILLHDGKAGDEQITLGFNGEHLFSSVNRSFKGNEFNWNIAYGSSHHVISIPQGGAVVSAFHPHRPLPSFSDLKVRYLMLQTLRTQRNLPPLKIVVTRGGRKTTIFWSHGRIRQYNGYNLWAYDGHILTLKVGKSFYRGKASRADVLDYLATLTNGEDSLSRSLLLRTNPLEDYLDPNGAVQPVGKMSEKGISSTILEIHSRSTKSSLIINDSTLLVQSAFSDTLATAGQVAAHDEATFDYYPLPTHSASLFQLQPPLHWVVKSFPKEAIHIGKFSDIRTKLVPRRHGK